MVYAKVNGETITVPESQVEQVVEEPEPTRMEILKQKASIAIEYSK